MSSSNSNTVGLTKSKKRFVGVSSSSKKIASAIQVSRQIPPEVINDPQLNQAIQELPSNYSFEIHKTIHYIRKNGLKMVALQMPEGLQVYACAISDIIERFTDALTVIMADVTYGACCIDDYAAIALECDLLIHYGHSCLVPIDQTNIKTLYIFVEIGIDSNHLLQTIRLNLPNHRNQFRSRILNESSPKLSIEGEEEESNKTPDTTRLALVSTIQFVAPLQKLKEDLSDDYAGPLIQMPRITHGENNAFESDEIDQIALGKYEVKIPRSKPLSPGEILGCTAPKLTDVDALLYLGDGRFHLESIMIANPQIPAFRYDPYSKSLTREYYDFQEMSRIRDAAIQTARRSLTPSNSSVHHAWGIVLGTLGRQGSLKQLRAIMHEISNNQSNVPCIPILLSELSPAKLRLFGKHISTFIQTSCPRLSIDWGYAFDCPLLSPYELSVALDINKSWMEGNQIGYPMDFYAADSPWALSRSKGEDAHLNYSG